MARRDRTKGPTLPLAVSLAVCMGLILIVLTGYTALTPNSIRCVVKEGWEIRKYGITWLGVIDKAEGVALAREKGTQFYTRCGLRYAAEVVIVENNGKPYLQTAKDDQKCGNLEALEPCDRLFPPLIGR